MVEAAAGTVGDRPAATGGAADGSETRKLVSEAYAREEILQLRVTASTGTGSRAAGGVMLHCVRPTSDIKRAPHVVVYMADDLGLSLIHISEPTRPY